MDIFKKYVWYTYKEERTKWFRLTLDQVQEIIALNKQNKKSSSLEDYESDIEIPEKVDFEDAVGQDSLTRFDVPRKRKRNNRNKKRRPATAAVASSENKEDKKQQPRKKVNHQKSTDNLSASKTVNKNKNRRRNFKNKRNNQSKNGNNSQEK